MSVYSTAGEITGMGNTGLVMTKLALGQVESSLKERPTWSTIYLQYILSNTSICFGRIYSPSSWGTRNGYYNWYLLFFLDYCLLFWLCSGTQPDVWRNTLKINCSSSWLFFKRIYREARPTKHKKNKVPRLASKNHIFIWNKLCTIQTHLS